MKEILVDVGFNQTRVALLENNELAEIYIDIDKGNQIVSNIYKGRVTNVLPGMQAAFVDIGFDKNAFLFVKDAQPFASFDEIEVCANSDRVSKDYHIKDLLRINQEIIVQVTKEAIDKKGPRITTHITIPGRYLVLMPFVDFVGVSRRIENDEERERLRKLANANKKDGFGLIVRTAAVGCSEEDFEADVIFLKKIWHNISEKYRNVIAPAIIHKDLTLVYRTVRDLFTPDVDTLIINNQEVYNKVIEILEITSPNMKSRVSLILRKPDIFDQYNIENKINGLASRKVWLKNKGYIIIDQTEALTSIDVNTGKFVGSSDLGDTVYRTNYEAAKEIAKQIRLRDIGGIIIIDFIDMVNKDHIEEILNVLKLTLKKDRTKTNVLGMTQLGLVEMTRKKARQSIESVLLSPCPYCEGEGKVLSNEMVARNIEREIYKILLETECTGMALEIGSGVSYKLMEILEERVGFISKLYKKNILIKITTELKAHQYTVRGIID